MILRILLLLCPLLAFAAAEPPSRPIPLPPQQAAEEGRKLAAGILAQKPAQNVTNTGVLTLRDGRGKRSQIPVRFEITATDTAWTTTYETTSPADGAVTAAILHSPGKPNTYRLSHNGEQKQLAGNDAMIPFAGSEFWLADLGLEFFQWPDQRLLYRDIRRHQSCNVLESINPNPAPGAYSRVLSWIDIDSDGIVFAEAYDARNQRLKQFAPKNLKKIAGEWQLEEMQMDNRQTGASTRIEFNLESKP